MGINYCTQNYAKVGCRRIRYVREGRGNAVILIHGLGGSLDWWDLTRPALAKRFCVYALDLPGSGMSDRLGRGVSREFAADFTAEFMKSVGIANATLVGHSMGGYVAALTALEHRAAVNGVVLVASAGFGRVHHLGLRALSLPIIGEIATAPTMLGARFLLRSLVFDKRAVTRDRIDTVCRFFRRPGVKSDFLRTLRARGTLTRDRDGLSGLGSLRELDVPTMLIWGVQDRVFPISQAQFAAALLPNARLAVLKRCGHLPQLEHAEEFNELVLRFLAQSK